MSSCSALNLLLTDAEPRQAPLQQSPSSASSSHRDKEFQRLLSYFPRSLYLKSFAGAQVLMVTRLLTPDPSNSDQAPLIRKQPSLPPTPLRVRTSSIQPGSDTSPRVPDVLLG